MNTKLTLKLDQKTVEYAKSYAAQQHTSLSKLVEHYFKSFNLSGCEKKLKLTPIVAELSGVASELSDKEDYIDYLKDKYS